ncbi:unnamed protein product [Oikopleura dioica]|uniref:Uncharacterized protein n=1 Tax=Oikopleura dioica TaxID=34765 RepID=Q675X0_OIKDI|nr:hypothetical protein 003-37 [Oikopleura dioica]CBY31595.1 unnamed protein product [Oikopleura dioica]
MKRLAEVVLRVKLPVEQFHKWDSFIVDPIVQFSVNKLFGIEHHHFMQIDIELRYKFENQIASCHIRNRSFMMAQIHVCKRQVHFCNSKEGQQNEAMVRLIDHYTVICGNICCQTFSAKITTNHSSTFCKSAKTFAEKYRLKILTF